MPSRNELIAILSAQDEAALEKVKLQVAALLEKQHLNEVYFRGLVEFSNICRCDCLYCGIRKSAPVNRYQMTKEEIMAAAIYCHESGFGSMVLQSGERQGAAFIDFVEETLILIKERFPKLEITLGVGEQSAATYKRFFKAGASRYLLRIETSSPDLFAKIHPGDQLFASRLLALRHLKEIGYQVGSGVMIGLPGQTIEMLADDLLFLKELDVDMVGMGPYVPSALTPMAAHAVSSKEERLSLSCLMIAALRLLMPDINIVAATALDAVQSNGRETALLFGANVVMPQVTAGKFRTGYQLYDNKPCLYEDPMCCRACLTQKIFAAGRMPGFNKSGTSQHFLKRFS